MSCEVHDAHQSHDSSKRIDWLLWVSGLSIVAAYLCSLASG